MKESIEIQELNRELFDILFNVFKEGFGKSPQHFSSIDDFSKNIRSTSKKRAERIYKALIKYEPEIRKFYGNKANRLFELIRKSGGLKYVLGGSNNFLSTHFKSVKSMALYGDMILIPDPVLPWLEQERNLEKFRHVRLIEQIFTLLHLKPLVDARLPYPAISVFPSWEKSLERNDPQTQKGINQLITNFFSYYLNIPFYDREEVLGYLKNHPDDFLKKIDSNSLFIAPEHGKENIHDSVKHYKEFINIWRSDDFKGISSKFSDAELVWVGIQERLIPQYHFWENSNELKANPMSCMYVHWYYHKLTSKMLAGIINSINPNDVNSIDSYVNLNNEKFKWIGNLKIRELVKLREDGANEEFRSEIRKALEHLNTSSIQDANNIAEEVAGVISNLLYKHQKQIKGINEKYFKKYGETVVFAAPGIAASFFPVLAPASIPITVATIGTKLAWHIGNHISELKKESKTIMGIFAKYKE